MKRIIQILMLLSIFGFTYLLFTDPSKLFKHLFTISLLLGCGLLIIYLVKNKSLSKKVLGYNPLEKYKEYNREKKKKKFTIINGGRKKPNIKKNRKK